MNSHSASAISTPDASSASTVSEGDGRYVDRRLLDSVEAFLARSIQRTGQQACNPDELFRIQQFLYQEAHLLDARRYQEWLELLAEDFVYWVPSSHDQPSLHTEVSVNFDDRRRILDRVAFTSTAGAFAQTPPSRTLRSLSNVQAWRGEGTTFEAAAGLVVWAHRRGRTTTFVGHLLMLLQPAADTFSIKMKVIQLLDCDEPQGNNTFIL